MCFNNKLDISEILDDIISNIKILNNILIVEKNKDMFDEQKIKNILHNTITLLLALLINKDKYKNNKLKNKILDIIKIIKDELLKIYIIENYSHDNLTIYINQIELFIYNLENIAK
jgi:hypothetical protein